MANDKEEETMQKENMLGISVEAAVKAKTGNATEAEKALAAEAREKVREIRERVEGAK